MKKLIWTTLLMSFMAVLACEKEEEKQYDPPSTSEEEAKVQPTVVSYLTTANGSSKLLLKEDFTSAYASLSDVNLSVDTASTYQTMHGFGFALTGGSAFLIGSMTESKQDELIADLFDPTGDGVSFSSVRITIGASDMDASVFSYNDLGTGQTDTALTQFSIEPDEKYLIPVLKKILALNPDIQILASPWSAPAWMKTNGSPKGGQLKTEYHSVYAQYFVKYIKAMADEGINISDITIQNEPLHDGNNPSMYMTAEQQADFIKDHLGPAFASNNISTKIICYDHNLDRMDYPMTVLDDPDANPYVAGSAFHLYGGSIGNLAQITTAHPDKEVYFTEQWYDGLGDFAGQLKWHTREVLIGAARNGCTTIIEWNLAASPTFGPHTVGGCTQCLGAITIDGDVITKNEGYFAVGHTSKFVPSGSVRIGSTRSNDIPNVCYRTPENKLVIIALNNTDVVKTINVSNGDEGFSFTLDPGSVATHIWDN